MPSCRVRFRPQGDHHVAPVDLDAVSADIVGERVQCAARDEVEAGVVPVAGKQPILYAAPVEREPHVGTAVIDGISLTLTQENAHRRGAHLSSEVTLGLQLVKGPYALP